MKGHYPNAFAGEPPYEVMGFKEGDEKILYAPLDWVGFHFYTRRVVADASDNAGFGGGFSGTEIETDSGTARDPYTGIRAAMPTEGPLTDSGLEVWPRGIYDLVMQISREYNHPVIEITESGCGYLDSPSASVELARQFPVGGRAHRAIRPHLYGLPQPRAHDQGLWILVRPGRCRQPSGCLTCAAGAVHLKITPSKIVGSA